MPTRELAMQVHKALATHSVLGNLRVSAVFGGTSFRPQIQELRRGTDIIVSTPGRLIDHLEQRTVDLSAVQILVLDEADRMLDMGFRPQLQRVLAALPRERQTPALLGDDVAGGRAPVRRFHARRHRAIHKLRDCMGMKP